MSATAKGTTSPGYRNPNKQVVVRPTGMAGTDFNNEIYELECETCGTHYGANGSDIHSRKCPKCGGGRPGLSIRQVNEPAAWSVADAKARFSELIEKATGGPQTITRNGKPTAVLVSIEEWKRKTSRRGTLAEFFQSAPEGFADLDITRLKSVARDIDL